jgi:hypothetical protein
MLTLSSRTAPMSTRRRRHHGPTTPPPPAFDHADRHALEQAGWRTLLDYRENHVRASDGTLVAVVPQWTGEAELARPAGTVRQRSAAVVATATASSPGAVWAELRLRTTAMMTSRRTA